MITIIKQNGKYYLKSYSLSPPQFQAELAILRRYGITYDSIVKASYHKNPKILLECLYELADSFETKISDEIKKGIELFDPFVPSFKPKRRKLNKEYFEKYKPIGQFQVDDVYKMFCLGRCLNANKMGLGKTFESIQTVNQIFDVGEADRILIIAIPPVLYNWKREILRFSPFFKEEDIVIVNKDSRNIFEDVHNAPKVVVMSYNTIRLVSDYHFKLNNPIKRREKKTEEQIKKEEDKIKARSKGYETCQIPFEDWGFSRIIILDEAHKIKNMQTRWTQIIHQAKKYFEFRYPLTGTPHPNGVQELYSNIKFLDDDLIEHNYNDFVKTIAQVGTQYSDYEIDHIIEYKANLFLDRIKPYVIRRFLRDHVELPPVYDKPIYIELSGKFKELYQRIVNEQLISVREEKGKITYRDISVKFPYILQAISDPCLLKGKLKSKDSELLAILDKWKFEDNVKYQNCKEIVETIMEDDPKSKICIWSEHPSTIDKLAEQFVKYGVVVVHGQNTPKGRDKDEWRDFQTQEVFKKDETKHILIANPATLGTGTNLQFVQNVIVYDEGFSFVDKDQKDARFERYGMIGSVTYWKLIVDNTIDCYVDEVLKDKELQDRVALKEGLTIDDLKEIFMMKAA